MEKRKASVKTNLFDRIVNAVSPESGLKRLRARASLQYIEDSGYMVPGSRRRAMRGWMPNSSSADKDTIPKLSQLRKGCRDLVMNSALAGAALNREATNVVGWGLQLQSNIDRELLGLSEEEARRWERNVEREFNIWAKSKECDAARTLNFFTMQEHVLYNVSLSGDIFILLPYIDRKRTPYRLALQAIEADIVENPHDALETNKKAGGIEVDDYGAPVRYWMKVPRLDSSLGYDTSENFKGVNVFGTQSGRRNVLHLYHKLRPGQRRGIPMLAPVIESLKQLTRLSDAELAASVINSFFTVFVKTDPQTGGLADGYIPEEKVTDEDEDERDENLYEVGSANVVELAENQSIDLADPKRPNDSFEPFFKAIAQAIGANLEIPYEQLILHFSSSYSASRAALLEAWKFVRKRRMWLGQELCQPVYEEWLMEAIALGRVSAPGFFDDIAIRYAWTNAQWIGPGQGQIDPLKETNAATKRIQARISNHEIEHAQIHGTSWESSMDRLSREKAYLEEKGIAVPTQESSTGGELSQQIQQIEDANET